MPVNYHNICDYWPAMSICPLFWANADGHLLIFKDFIKIKFQGHLEKGKNGRIAHI